jgi:hypothetical protein
MPAPLYTRAIALVVASFLACFASTAKADDERTRIIWSLLWTADFDAMVDSVTSEYFARSVKSFQRRQGFFETGTLDASQKQLLFAMARQISNDVGAHLFTDARAGVKLVVPTKYITDVKETRIGTELTGHRHGAFGLATFSLPAEDGSFEELYQFLRGTVGGRTAKTRFAKLEQNRMIIVRIHEPLRTYVLAVRTPTGVKGFSMTWSIANTEMLHRAVSVAANTLAPFSPVPVAPRAERRAGPRSLEASYNDVGATVQSVVDVLEAAEPVAQ